MRQLRAMLASMSAIVDQVEALQEQLQSLHAAELAGAWPNDRGGARGARNLARARSARAC